MNHQVSFSPGCRRKAALWGQKGAEKAGQRLPLRFQIRWCLLSIFQQVCSDLYTLFTLTETENQFSI